MKTSRIVHKEAKNEFWAVVGDCLREFHGLKQEVCRRKIGKLRNAIEGMKPTEVELFYHSEPFDVSCDIADNPLDLQVYLERYLKIRDQTHDNGIPRQKRSSSRNRQVG